MTLYTYHKTENTAIYGIAINGISHFFFSGFDTAEEAKDAILSQYTGIEETWMKTFLIGEWSPIQ